MDHESCKSVQWAITTSGEIIMKHLLYAGVAATAFAACATQPEGDTMPRADLAAVAVSVGADPANNVFLTKWSGPYRGVPAFDQMDLAQLQPALEGGMAMSLAEIEGIVANPEPATFENTILALEDSGRDLSGVLVYYGILGGNLSTPEFR